MITTDTRPNTDHNADLGTFHVVIRPISLIDSQKIETIGVKYSCLRDINSF